MVANLQLVLLSLAPIFALIGLGYVLRRLDFPGEPLWSPLERLVYYILFPALLVDTLAGAELSPMRGLWVGAAVIGAIGSMSIVLLLLRPAFRTDGPAFTSVFQGGIRFNTYVGIAAALGLFGREGAAVAAMVMAVMIPLVNVLSVAVLSHYAHSRATVSDVIRGIVRNPLILACLAGLALNLSEVGLPAGVEGIAQTLGRAALPLGLMTVGAGLELRTTWKRRGVIAAGTVIKLAALPALCLGFAQLLSLSALETQILVLFGALPTATSAYILARQLGGDGALMAGLLTAQTLAAAVTLPVTLVLLGA